MSHHIFNIRSFQISKYHNYKTLFSLYYGQYKLQTTGITWYQLWKVLLKHSLHR
jgi:hypothetical protein